jgi:hypothetical protein
MPIGVASNGYVTEYTEAGSAIRWQEGTVSEVGVTGDQPESILPSVIARLRALNRQSPNRETSLAITHCEEALHWLQARTASRIARGVEGTRQP